MTGSRFLNKEITLNPGKKKNGLLIASISTVFKGQLSDASRRPDVSKRPPKGGIGSVEELPKAPAATLKKCRRFFQVKGVWVPREVAEFDSIFYTWTAWKGY